MDDFRLTVIGPAEQVNRFTKAVRNPVSNQPFSLERIVPEPPGLATASTNEITARNMHNRYGASGQTQWRKMAWGCGDDAIANAEPVFNDVRTSREIVYRFTANAAPLHGLDRISLLWPQIRFHLLFPTGSGMKVETWARGCRVSPVEVTSTSSALLVLVRAMLDANIATDWRMIQGYAYVASCLPLTGSIAQELGELTARAQVTGQTDGRCALWFPDLARRLAFLSRIEALDISDDGSYLCGSVKTQEEQSDVEEIVREIATLALTLPMHSARRLEQYALVARVLTDTCVTTIDPVAAILDLYQTTDQAERARLTVIATCLAPLFDT